MRAGKPHDRSRSAAPRAGLPVHLVLLLALVAAATAHGQTEIVLQPPGEASDKIEPRATARAETEVTIQPQGQQTEALQPIAAPAEPTVLPPEGPFFPPGPPNSLYASPPDSLYPGPVPPSGHPALHGWELYVQGGPVMTLGDGFLEERLKTGWIVQLGLREILTASPDAALFHEFGGLYAANQGDDLDVTFSGFFQGLDPPDAHVHPFDNFVTTNLERVDRGGVHYALGTYLYLREPGHAAPPLARLRGRLGIRSGFLEADLNRRQNPEVTAGIAEHFGHGHQRVFVSTEGGEDPELFFGAFASLGIDFLGQEVWLARRPLGHLSIGAEVEVGHDWFDLGDYGEGDDGIWTLSPMLTVVCSR